jgi:hypothetical protein
VKPLYVLTSVFNPRRFRSRYRLYRNFAAWLERTGVRLLTAEVAFGDRPFEVTESGNPWHLQLRSSADMWHKERSLNLAVNRLCALVPDWEYVCYLDADIKLLRDDWAEETVQLLQHYAVLQPFGELYTTGPNGELIQYGQSIAKRYHDAGRYPADRVTTSDYKKLCGTNGWPGLGWAYRRHEFEKIGGLYDVAVSSSGDMHMAGCYLGVPELGMNDAYSDGFKRSVQRHYELCDKHIRGNVSYTPGLLVHYWHGKGKDRGHAARKAAIESFAFDPYTDILPDAQGLYQWRGNKVGLERAIRRSMEARNEDSIDV